MGLRRFIKSLFEVSTTSVMNQETLKSLLSELDTIEGEIKTTTEEYEGKLKETGEEFDKKLDELRTNYESKFNELKEEINKAEE